MNKGPWGGRGAEFLKSGGVGRLECRFFCFWQCDPVLGDSVLSRRGPVMCEVMSSSGVVVGVHGTWCAAWDGVCCALPFVFTVYKQCGAGSCSKGTT